MTAEKLHDAISLLPADLIAEADRLRCGRPQVIRWKRYTAMAACFALVLSCGLFAVRFLAPKGATETALQAPAAAAPLAPPEQDLTAAEEAAPEMPASNRVTGSGSPAEAAEPEAAEPEGYAFCDMTARMIPWPGDLCVNSTQCILIRSREQLEAYVAGGAELTEAAVFYDEAWFENHDLVMVRQAGKSEERYGLVSLTQPDNDWVLTFRRDVLEEDNSPEPVLWHIFVGVDKNLIGPEEQILAVTDESKTDICVYPTAPVE